MKLAFKRAKLRALYAGATGGVRMQKFMWLGVLVLAPALLAMPILNLFVLQDFDKVSLDEKLHSLPMVAFSILVFFSAFVMIYGYINREKYSKINPELIKYKPVNYSYIKFSFYIFIWVE